MGLAEEYLETLDLNLDTVVEREWSHMVRGGDLIAGAISGGHTAYEYLAGHLMPGEAGPGREGRPDVLEPLPKDTATVQPGDVVLMTLQYGVLEQFVQVALDVKARGATIIGVAPRSDPAAIVRTHPTGKSIADIADVLIDTHIPEGDVALQAPSGSPGSCPTSGVVQAFVHWALVCGVAERLA